MTQVFQDIVKQNPFTDKQSQQSIDWLRKLAKSVTRINPTIVIDEAGPFKRIQNLSVNSIGKMYMFFYDPKLKATLPYYDTFPLVFPIDFKEGGFLGINLHYLPPYLRAKLMDNLYKTSNNTKYDDTTKLKISYQILNGASQFSYFKPCVKRYLWDHVVGNYLYVEPKNWDTALMLPTERFNKANKQTVFKDSVKATS